MKQFKVLNNDTIKYQNTIIKISSVTTIEVELRKLSSWGRYLLVNGSVVGKELSIKETIQLREEIENIFSR